MRLRPDVFIFTLLVVGTYQSYVGDPPHVASSVVTEEDFNHCKREHNCRRYDVIIMEVPIVLNNWGDHLNSGFMFTLRKHFEGLPCQLTFSLGLLDSEKLNV